MSSNGEKDEEHTSPPVTITESKVYEIHTSLNNINRQGSDLNKYTECLFGKVSEELGRILSNVKALQENVVQLADFIRHKIPKEGLYMQDWKLRKNFSRMFIQAQQVYSSTSLFIKNIERNYANMQIPPLNMTTFYQQGDMESLMMCSDDSVESCSHYPEHFKENISVNEEQKEKLTQNKNLDHLSQPETVATCQLMKEDGPLDLNRAACGKVPHSYVYQPTECSSLFTYPFRASSKPPAKFIILHGRPYQLLPGIRGEHNSHPYVIYGTGKGEVVQPSPPTPTVTHHRTEAFVSPMALEAPLLLPDGLAPLRASKRSDPPEMTHSPAKSSSSVLEITRSPLDWLQTTDRDLPVIPSQAEFSPALPEPFEFHELTPEDIASQGKAQRISPSVSPPVISADTQSCNSVMDLVDSVSTAQQPRSSVFQSVKSFAQSPRPSVTKSPVSSLLPKPSSAHRPKNLSIHMSVSSTAPQPRSSTLQNPQHSVPVSSESSCPQIPVSSNPLPGCTLNQLSRHREARSPRAPVSNSERHLYSPQLRTSSLNSTKISTLQSSSSFQSSSLYQLSTFPISSDLNQYPSNLQRVTKTRKELMEAKRRGGQQCKTKNQYVPKEKMETSKNLMTIIQLRRKAMGYNSEKSDSDVDWQEEK